MIQNFLLYLVTNKQLLVSSKIFNTFMDLHAAMFLIIPSIVFVTPYKGSRGLVVPGED